MKKNISFILLLATLTSCDSPQRGRGITTSVGTNNLSTDTTGTTAGSSFGTTTGTTTGSSATTASPGFESCDLADKYYSQALGYFGLCQNTQDETILKLRPSLSDQSMRTCLIPTYKETTGSSTYIGQPQCTLTSQNVPLIGKLYKNRSGFGSYPINGVMVMKENLLTGYFACMNAYANYVSQACPYGARTNAMCNTYALQFRDNLCAQFKTQNASSYVDIRLK